MAGRGGWGGILLVALLVLFVNCGGRSASSAGSAGSGGSPAASSGAGTSASAGGSLAVAGAATGGSATGGSATGGSATAGPIDAIDAGYPPEDDYVPPDDVDPDLTCEQQDVTDCEALVAAGVGVDLGTCQLCQGAACGADAGDECAADFPCVDGFIVIRGCCSDRDCSGLTSFCGMYMGPHYLCVTHDDI